MSWAEVKVLKDELFKKSRFGYLETTISTMQRPDLHLPNMPYAYYNGAVVVLNDEIHVLGGNNTNHYKWDGTSWVSVSTLPYNLYMGSAVVLNGEIHILGTYSMGDPLSHYKWDGTSWVSVSTLPYGFNRGGAVVLNGEIHILGGGQTSVTQTGTTNHYKWDGTSWVSVSTLPYTMYGAGVVVLNDEIHMISGNSSPLNHYKWDGTSWVSVSTLASSFVPIWCVVLEDEIFIGTANVCRKWNRTSWSADIQLPYNTSYGSAVVMNGNIHILGGGSSGSVYHYKSARLLNGNVVFMYETQRKVVYVPSDVKIYCDTRRTMIQVLNDAEYQTADYGYLITKAGLIAIQQIDENGQYVAIG